MESVLVSPRGRSVSNRVFECHFKNSLPKIVLIFEEYYEDKAAGLFC